MWSGLRRSPDLKGKQDFKAMRIEIFGAGCAKCEKTAREVERVVKER
jgi:hypothetical protein